MDLFLVIGKRPLLAISLFGFGVSVIDLMSLELSKDAVVNHLPVDFHQPQLFLKVIAI